MAGIQPASGDECEEDAVGLPAVMEVLMKWFDGKRRESWECLLAAGILAAAFAWFHFSSVWASSDTLYFLNELSRVSVSELLWSRFENVTSRVVLEAILFFFLKHSPVWFYVCNTAVVILTVFMLGFYGREMGKRCFRMEEAPPFFWLLTVFLFFCYPFGDMTVAGVPGSFINYVWSGTFGMAALLPLCLLLMNRGEGVYSKKLWLLSALCVIPAANMEQPAALLFFFLPAGAVYLFRKGVKSRGILVLWGLTICSMAFLLSQGNAVRVEMSAQAYWPEFTELNLMQKLWNGVASTMNYLLCIPNMIFLSFAVLLALLALSSPQKSVLWRLSGLIPLFWEGVILAAKAAGKLLGRDLLRWFNGVEDLSLGTELSPLGAGLPLFLQALVLGSAVLFLWQYLDTVFWKISIIGLLGIGFASRVLMGFSPTLFESHMRTFYYMYLTLLAAELCLAAGLGKCSAKYYRFYWVFIALLGNANFVRVVLKIAG